MISSINSLSTIPLAATNMLSQPSSFATQSKSFSDFLKEQKDSFVDKINQVDKNSKDYIFEKADIGSVVPMVAELSLEFDSAVKVVSQGINSLKTLLNMPI
jgi:flagellar hook-basal body complex protein FliE